MALTKIKPAGLDKPIDLANNEKIRLGGTTGVELYHNGSKGFIDNNTGDLEIVSAARIELQGNNGSQTLARFTNDGKSELFYNGTSKIETTDTGVKVTDAILEIADTSCLIDLMETGATDGNHRIRNGSGNFLIQNITDDKSTTRDQLHIDGGTGVVSLYHNGSKKLETNIHGIAVTDSHDTSVQINLNTSDTDTHGYVYADTSNNVGFLTSEGEWAVRCVANGGTELRCDNNPKLVTTTTGVNITGNLKLDASAGIHFSGYDAGGVSNLLDDYEEGTFTPEWGVWGGNEVDGAFTYYVDSNNITAQQGVYIKIGRQVTCWFYINYHRISTVPDGTYVRLKNLPFTVTEMNANHYGATEGATMVINWKHLSGSGEGGGGTITGFAHRNRTHILLGNKTQTAVNAFTPAECFGTSTITSGSNQYYMYGQISYTTA